MLSEYTKNRRCTKNVRNYWKLWKTIQSNRRGCSILRKIRSWRRKKVTFDNVVLLSDDKKVEVGAPYVKGVKVEGKVVSHGKGKKILVYKYKAKKNYRRTQGHRQPYTKVEITKIKMPTEKAEAKVEKAEVKETAAKATTKKATTKKEA